MPTSPALSSRPLRWLLAFTVAHLALSLLAIEIRSGFAGDPIFWGLSGLSSAVIAQTPVGRRRWYAAAVVTSSVVTYLIAGSPVAMAAGFAVANGVQAVVAARIFHRYLPQGRRIVRLRDIAWLVTAGISSASVGAGLGAATRWAAVGSVEVATVGTWFMANTVGIVIGAPVILALFSLRAEPPHLHMRIPAIVVGGVTTAVFAGAVVASSSTGRNFSYLILVPVMVAAVWLGQRHTAILVGGLAVAVAVGTSRGIGPFAAVESTFDPLLTAQLFMSVVQLTALTVGVEASRRRDVIAELDGILAATVEGVFVVDDTGTIRHSNAGGEGILGAPSGGLVGRHLDEFVAEDGIEDGTTLHLARAERVDGSMFWAEVSRGEIHEGSGRRRSAVVVRDVTGRIETEEKVRRIQDEFVAYMTHELKTPLTAIIGFSEWLLAEPDSPTLSEDLETIRDSALSMKKLIDDILDFKRVATADAEHEAVDMRDLVESSVDRVSPAAVERGVEFRVDLDLIPTVSGDAGQLGHAVQNILSNAVKYSNPGGKVHVALSEQGSGVVLSVADQGIGIPEADLEGLFERFYRAGNTGDIHGTGLGLALVRQVALRHGGEVELDSVLGRGTHVRLTLPVEPAGSTASPGSPRSALGGVVMAPAT